MSNDSSEPGLESTKALLKIYEDQAIEAAIYHLNRLNRGQTREIRAKNPQLANFLVDCLSPDQDVKLPGDKDEI